SQCLQACRMALSGGCRQRPSQPLLPLGDVALNPPEASECGRESQRIATLVARLEANERVAQVVLLTRDASEPFGLAGTGQPRLRLLGEGQVVVSVPVTNVVELPARPQALGCVLANRLQQAVA